MNASARVCTRVGLAGQLLDGPAGTALPSPLVPLAFVDLPLAREVTPPAPVLLMAACPAPVAALPSPSPSAGCLSPVPAAPGVADLPDHIRPSTMPVVLRRAWAV